MIYLVVKDHELSVMSALCALLNHRPVDTLLDELSAQLVHLLCETSRFQVVEQRLTPKEYGIGKVIWASFVASYIAL